MALMEIIFCFHFICIISLFYSCGSCLLPFHYMRFYLFICKPALFVQCLSCTEAIQSASQRSFGGGEAKTLQSYRKQNQKCECRWCSMPDKDKSLGWDLNTNTFGTHFITALVLQLGFIPAELFLQIPQSTRRSTE